MSALRHLYFRVSAISLFLIFLFCRCKDTLEYDEEAEHCCDRDTCPPGGQRSLEGDERLDRTLYQYAEEASEDIADTACQKRTADDGGSDRIHFKTLRLLYEA